MAMIAVASLSAASFLYVMAVAIPNEAASLRVRDGLVDGGLCAVGVAYVAWGARSHQSVVVGLLGSAEILALPGFAWLALRTTGLGRTGWGLLVLLALVAVFLFPWTRVDRIRLAVWHKTGLR